MANNGDEPEICKIVQQQRKTIERLNKEQVILENKISALKKKVEEVSLVAKKKAKETKMMLQQKLAQNRSSMDSEKATMNNELAASKKELQEIRASMTDKGTKISQLAAENESLKK